MLLFDYTWKFRNFPREIWLQTSITTDNFQNCTFVNCGYVRISLTSSIPTKKFQNCIFCHNKPGSVRGMFSSASNTTQNTQMSWMYLKVRNRKNFWKLGLKLLSQQTIFKNCILANAIWFCLWYTPHTSCCRHFF